MHTGSVRRFAIYKSGHSVFHGPAGVVDDDRRGETSYGSGIVTLVESALLPSPTVPDSIDVEFLSFSRARPFVPAKKNRRV